MEVTENKKFMFLTVTNKAAAALNQARLQLEFPEEARQLAEGRGWPAEVGRVLLATHMRVRLTHNVNKDEGFVNGNMGHIRKMLRSDVFIMESSQQTSIKPCHRQRPEVFARLLRLRHHHAQGARGHSGCGWPSLRPPAARQGLCVCRHLSGEVEVERLPSGPSSPN